MTRILLVVALVGCGHVVTPPATGGGVDPEVCQDPTSVDSCGPSCTACQATSDRDFATCDGNACGTACTFEVCSDNSCGRLDWSFDDGTLDGIAVRAPSDLVLAVRDHDGSPALAIDVSDLTTEVSFTLPVCLSGTLDLSALTLTANVTFEGTATTGTPYGVLVSVPEPVNGSFIGSVAIDAGVPAQVVGSLGQSPSSVVTKGITFQATAMSDVPFTGTIWFDDITIQ